MIPSSVVSITARERPDLLWCCIISLILLPKSLHFVRLNKRSLGSCSQVIFLQPKRIWSKCVWWIYSQVCPSKQMSHAEFATQLTRPFVFVTKNIKLQFCLPQVLKTCFETVLGNTAGSYWSCFRLYNEGRARRKSTFLGPRRIPV